ncbi:MAG: type II secretion system protein M [Gammaproteobacteria bacterium]|nr:type II secretion system protein M [Gammaproteobacteria bacterium]MCW5583402.1 type II secretion system protein M [Gammaproteobacteria bacterium]
MKELWAKMKEWWSGLALREKQVIGIGTVLLVLFIAYQWVWAPYLNHIVQMREQIVASQKTLSWMQAANDVIQKVENKTKEKNKSISLVVLLSQIQKQIAQAGLGQSLTQLKQASNDSVEIQFQKVEFDKLIKLLVVIIKEQNVSVTRMSVIANSVPGLVNTSIVMKL